MNFIQRNLVVLTRLELRGVKAGAFENGLIKVEFIPEYKQSRSDTIPIEFCESFKSFGSSSGSSSGNFTYRNIGDCYGPSFHFGGSGDESFTFGGGGGFDGTSGGSSGFGVFGGTSEGFSGSGGFGGFSLEQTLLRSVEGSSQGSQFKSGATILGEKSFQKFGTASNIKYDYEKKCNSDHALGCEGTSKSLWVTCRQKRNPYSFSRRRNST